MVAPRYVVAQVGARRNYAVPAALASADMLSAFYTDICGNVGLGRLSRAATFLSPAAARLANRTVPEAVRPFTRTFPIRTTMHTLRTGIAGRTPQDRFRAHLRWQNSLGDDGHEFGAATHFFSMLGEFPQLIRAAKQRGLRVVSEVYIALNTEAILAAERKAFPSWEPEDHDFQRIRDACGAGDALLELTDTFLCPSEVVADDLTRRLGVAPDCTKVVPYGVSESWLRLDPVPRPGRVLFAGSAGLRKGIHYLAMASERIAASGSRLEFRVAGDVTTAVTSQPACRHLKFLGRVNRTDVAGEFAEADVFVLPTLAEGSAEVIYEALAAGLPVITTRSAGSVVRDGVEGRIVPERDATALAEAILEVTGDRTLRDRMSSAARARAREFTWSNYADRLVRQLRAA